MSTTAKPYETISSISYNLGTNKKDGDNIGFKQTTTGTDIHLLEDGETSLLEEPTTQHATQLANQAESQEKNKAETQ